ncbi:hypothetical protein [Streptomyces celluloflavus]|uniref:hypothetical protein n=1 Tax=Streptomyces celluloflavus TaxID=58344 RepID=UPI00367AF80E
MVTASSPGITVISRITVSPVSRQSRTPRRPRPRPRLVHQLKPLNQLKPPGQHT